MTADFSLSEFSRVIVFSPHPDDEALGCAGSLLLMNRKGATSTIVHVTDGEKLHGPPSASVAEERRSEAARAAGMLGCRDVVFLGIPDGEVRMHGHRAFELLSTIIEGEKPDLVLAPSPVDFHEDHIAVSQIALKLLKALHSFTLGFYEVYSTIRFNRLVDIGEVVEAKKAAILNYHVSLYGKPEIYAHAALGLNAQRALFVQHKGYYEALYFVKEGEDLDSILSRFCYRDR